MKKLYIKTYGCQMNVYDSQRMADVLLPLGYEATDGPDDADMMVLNTCHIREKAAEKVYSELGRLRAIKDSRVEDGKTTIIAVAGCVAQAEGEEIMRRAPCVDMVVGPQTYHRLPELIARAARETGGVMDLDFPPEPKFDYLPPVSAKGFSAFLSIQEGCDKFCTFCVVPYTRGAEYSRPVADVVAEAALLVGGGVREITLLGQNVNAYHGAGSAGEVVGLGALIRQLAKIEGLSAIRYTTSHPADVDEELIRAHGEVEALMPFLHLPVQSGSDRILGAMNRHHNVDHYREVIARLKAARSDLKFSTDLIVGFPGETDADFEATMALVREIGFVQAFSFKYSARPGTPGATMPNHVPEDVKSERLAALQSALLEIQEAFNEDCVGRTLPVLLDRAGRHFGQLVGRTPYMQPVHLDAPAGLMGEVVPVTIAAAHRNSLTGVLVDYPVEVLAAEGARA